MKAIRIGNKKANGETAAAVSGRKEEKAARNRKLEKRKEGMVESLVSQRRAFFSELHCWVGNGGGWRVPSSPAANKNWSHKKLPNVRCAPLQ